MKKLHWLLASAVIVVAGCGDEEAAVSREDTSLAAHQESTEMVSGVVAEMTEEPVDQAVLSDIVAAETAMSATAESMEPVGDTLEPLKDGVNDGVVVVAATASTATAKLEGETPAATPDPAAAGVATFDLAQGKKVYSGSCFACHGSGVAGSPKLGNAESWAPRIAQGTEVMVAHAINGFKGASGYMPAKGGANSLTDEEVTAAVAYMVSESR